jgi:hypothetical protein
LHTTIKNNVNDLEEQSPMYSEQETFNHLKKLAIAYASQLTFLDSHGFGEWGVDQKRPFGNSSVKIDILEICGIEPADGDSYSIEQQEYAYSLYRNKLGQFLRNAITTYVMTI